jgi:hypothetical protein
MTVRQRQRAIHLVAGIVGLSGLAVFAAALAVPLDPGAPGPDVQGAADGAAAAPAEAPAQATPDAAGASLEDLARVCGMDLRRPLYDAPSPPPAAGAAAPPAAPMAVRLVGTIVEPGHSMAVFQKPDGSFELCAQGESVADAGGAVAVTAINQDKVTVQYLGQTQELALPPNPAGEVLP